MKIFIPGHAGYVGSKLVPVLQSYGHEISGYDLDFLKDKLIHQLVGDIRNIDGVRRSLEGCDAVIHLACLSNDPTADLSPDLTKSINYDSFRPLVKAAKEAGVRRFIFASSSSVYGVKKDPNVTEDLPLQPLTDYSKYKAMCEEVLLEEREHGFEVVIVRPATICGYSPNIRLDLCVHILTMAALRKKEITVFGGDQYRPNIHIDDIISAYITLLTADGVDGEIFNVGYQNLTIQETAEMIQRVCGGKIINKSLVNDPRSYHVSSAKYDKRFPGQRKTIESAIIEIKEAYESGKIPDPDSDKYYRIRSIKNMGLL